MRVFLSVLVYWIFNVICLDVGFSYTWTFVVLLSMNVGGIPRICLILLTDLCQTAER